MNKVKYILIFLLVLLLSGCNATYKIYIDDDINIEESVILDESYNVLYSFSANPTSYMEEQLANLKEENMYSSYSMETYIKNSRGYGKATRKYDSLENYKTSSDIVKDIFSNIIIKKEENVVSLLMQPVDQFEYFLDAEEYSSFLENLNIEIEVPFKVIQNNAEEVDGKIYKWSFEKSESLSEIKLSFDTSKNLDNAMPLSIKIVIGLVAFVLLVCLYVYIKYKRNSR